MKYRMLDPITQDKVWGQGDQSFFTGVEAVTQAYYTKLKLLKGEWWEDQGDGLPLWQSIIAANGSADSIRAVDLIIQKRLAETPGHQSIDSYTSNFDSKTRTYTFEAVCTTIYSSNAITITD